MFWRRNRKKLPSKFDWKAVVCVTDGVPWTVEDFCRHFFIFGSTGSGKSSGILANLLAYAAAHGFGGYLTTIKPGDTAAYLRIFKRLKMVDRVKVWSPGSGLVLNVAQQEANRETRGGGVTENLVEVLMEASDLADNNSKRTQGQHPYFLTMKKVVLRNTIGPIVKAHADFTLDHLQESLHSLPMRPDLPTDPSWQAHAACYQNVLKAKARVRNDAEAHELVLGIEFIRQWAQMDPRVRSDIFSDVTGTVDILNRGMPREMTSGQTNLSLDLLGEGHWIIADAPVLQWHAAGLLVQGLGRYGLFRWAQARTVTPSTRPVMCLIDECQYFVTKHDTLAATTGRSAKLSLVYATQTLPSLKAVMHNLGSDHEPEMLVGTFANKVFANNTDPSTNIYASDTIGRRLKMLTGGNISPDMRGFNPFFLEPPQMQLSYHQVMEHIVPPFAFSQLRRGGPPDFTVSSIVSRGNEPIGPNGEPWALVRWAQQL